jgi:hypothetical protein
MSKTFQVELESSNLGQLLDGLRVRDESWRNTAIYLRDDYFPDDAFVCEECSNAEEAEWVADHFRKIICDIEQQIEKQGGR